LVHLVSRKTARLRTRLHHRPASVLYRSWWLRI